MTKRQLTLLKLIVESYIAEGEPIGSEHLLTAHRLDLSSATIRNEMLLLEQQGFLQKSHVSSGRVPSTQGYEYYAKNLAQVDNRDLTVHLDDILARRRLTINATVDEAAEAIAELAGLTVTIASFNSEETMKSIQVTPIDEANSVVVIVTSSGRVESKTISFSKRVLADDVRVAVRLFKERLVNTPMRELASQARLLAPLLAASVKDYEALIQTFARQVFDFHTAPRNKVYGNGNMIKSDLTRDQLVELMKMLETRSVWELIDDRTSDDTTLKIAIKNDSLALLSKRIVSDDAINEVSVIGSRRLDYVKAKEAIAMLERILIANKKEL